MSDGGGNDSTFPAGLMREGQRGDLDGVELKHISEVAGKLDVEEIDAWHDLDAAFDEVDGWDLMELDWAQRQLKKSSDVTATKAVWNKNGPVMQNQIGLRESTKNDMDALPLVVGILEKGAATVYVWGGQESGKTHYMLWLVDRALKFGLVEACVTNIPVNDADVVLDQDDDVAVEVDGDEISPDDVDGQRDDVELLVGGDDVVDDVRDADVVRVGRESHARAVAACVDGRVVEAVDEWGTKGGGNKGKNPNAGEEMVRHFKEMRHRPYTAIAVVGGHEPSDLEKGGRALLDLGVYKPTQTVAQLYRGVDLDGGTDFMTDMSVSSHDLDDYDDKGATPWLFDGDGVEDDGMTDEEIRARAQALRDAGKSCRKIAEDDDIPYSKSWVSTHTTE